MTLTMLIMYIIHLRGSQGGLDHAGGVADKGEHRPVCRLSNEVVEVLGEGLLKRLGS